MTTDRTSPDATGEVDEVRKRCERRRTQGIDWRYNLLNPAVWQMVHERQRALLQLLHRLGWEDLAQKTLLEVGCGSGGKLLEMLRFGFDARRVTLAPPVARQVVRLHPSLYTLFNMTPLLRTHVLAWIEKPPS